MILKLKSIAKAKPGKRFYLLHRYSRKKLSNPLVLLMFLIISIVALILGLIMLFTPGPGLFFIGLALLPFIAISKKLARSLDKLEIYLRRKIKKKI
ncbi:hypothetical protein IB633_03335 [Francisella philomiragia]|uniref:Transmembrane family protein n=2 Tax=Francisella philomiragia TaxID=28110 RepID=B0TX21_FRAP2|nr:hypothetical protein [Francisella philomiragia]AJI47479.1 transmembrane family protein [Francisella philomiragia]AJI49490.1 transmembrane family protein [Francisella philomiragia]MBK2020423.1 hypothetical protein [Francisella philomiragia]MBK2030123.1 hypothetical protein [Francisella philomiragia]MBK2263120.1 hypothetical protein [Francisella philomiragia]